MVSVAPLLGLKSVIFGKRVIASEKPASTAVVWTVIGPDLLLGGTITLIAVESRLSMLAGVEGSKVTIVLSGRKF